MSRRITTAIISTLVITLVLVGIGTFIAARLTNRADTIAQLEQQATRTSQLLQGLAVVAPVDNPATQTRAQAIREQLVEALNLTGVGDIVIGPAGRFIGDLPAGVRASDLDLAALGAGEIQSGQRGNTLWAAAGRNETLRNRQVEVVTVLTRQQERFFGPTFRWFLVSAAISLVIGIAVSVYLGRRLGRPVLAAATTTQRIATGDLGARLAVPPAASDDELAILARSINTMADELGRAREQERQFLLSVSHDLRTPMTSIRGYAEAIADGAAPDPKRAAGVIVSESRRLERLVSDLLDLARLDAHRFTLDLRSADLAEITAGTVESFGPELRDAGLDLHEDLERAGSLWADVDVDRFAQVIANLTTNAVSYARSAVWAQCRLEGATAVIEISDDGPGIDPDAIPHVFDRLYQADNQRDRRSSGTGLGLAIVAELTALMGGRVEVRSIVDRGTTFSVMMPLGAQSASTATGVPPTSTVAGTSTARPT
jgi:two-component system sensor histidine kinase BaeS